MEIILKNYWCEDCGERWATNEEPKKCPKCHGLEIRKTMSREEAEQRGLL